MQTILQGYSIDFISQPPAFRGILSTDWRSDLTSKQCITEEVNSLLEKGAIESVSNEQAHEGFYSRIFLIPKKGGGMRPILNVKPLNKFIRKEKFKMQTVRTVLQSLNQGDWAGKLDLKDAYFQIPVHPDHRKFLRFSVAGNHFQYKVLCFGLTSAPRVFTKVMAVLGAYLHSHQIRISQFLDDWIICARNKKEAQLSIQRTVLVSQELGLVINQGKSMLTPTQNLEYLGMDLDLKEGIVKPSQERFQNLLKDLEDFQLGSVLPAKKFLGVLGRMTACIDIVPWGRLFMRPIQLYLLSQWRPHIQDIETKIPVLQSLLPHLEWWKKKENVLKGVSLEIKNPQSVMITDASKMGWGAHIDNDQVSGSWSPTIANTKHINWLEMKAVFLGLQHFVEKIKNKIVLVKSDNSTVVSYLTKQGGTKSPDLCYLTWEVLNWCRSKGVSIRAVHIPGHLNVIADRLSRGNPIKRTEWSLASPIVQQVFLRWGQPLVDLFATDQNKQCLTYCSLVPEQNALATDAFTISWEGMMAYAFPPPILLSRVLKKIKSEDCVIILIAPLWPRQVWYPDLLDLLIAIPLKLPVREDLLSQDQGRLLHPDPGALKLVAWNLSRSKKLRKDFLRGLPASWHPPGEHPHQGPMMLGLGDSTAGVTNGIQIPLQPL